ncbi:MAG: sulfite exporter TauE/SafE family protein [Nitrospinota bacterium]|nr:MAG: sulfite exporter TauE/SafE family protein [Nitrospinota bacterium]
MKRVLLVLIAGLVTLICTAAVTEKNVAERAPVVNRQNTEKIVIRDSSRKLSGKLAVAIAETPVGTGLDRRGGKASQGVAGIPGAPQPSYLIAVLWAIWVGWIFSTIGAFGGIMAGVGHITIFGLGDYAKTLQKTDPMLNKLLTDTIRASNQYLVALASLISTFNFYRMKRIVLPLGVALGTGSLLGAVLIPWLTAGKIHVSQYIGYFGIVVLIIGGLLFYETTPRGQRRKQKAQETAAAFQKRIKEKGITLKQGVQVSHVDFEEVCFRFLDTEFRFHPILPVIGGFLIAALSSFLGVGGGFLYVPFMTSIVGLPMFLVAGTSALAVFLSMVVSLFTYVAIKGTLIDWSLIGVEMVGVCIGAMIGPRTQQYIPDIWLKRIFVVLALYVGLRYFSKGFFGQSWLPPE